MLTCHIEVKLPAISTDSFMGFFCPAMCPSLLTSLGLSVRKLWFVVIFKCIAVEKRTRNAGRRKWTQISNLHVDSVNTSKISSLLCPFFHNLAMTVHCQETLLLLLDSLLQFINKDIKHQCCIAYCCFCFHFGEIHKQPSRLRSFFLHFQLQVLLMLLSARLQLLLVSPQPFLKVWQWLWDFGMLCSLAVCGFIWDEILEFCFTLHLQRIKFFSWLKWCLNMVVECVQVIFPGPSPSPTPPQIWNYFFNFFGLVFDQDQNAVKKGSNSNIYQAGKWYIVKIKAMNYN